MLRPTCHAQHARRQKDDKRYRAQYIRWLKLRDVDWRESFRQGMAEEARVDARTLRKEKQRVREQAWAEYKERLFEAAGASEGQQTQVAVEAGASKSSR